MSKQDKIVITPAPQKAELTVNQWVYRTLRRALMCGQVKPGHPLTIRGVAQILDVSPMPVREALRRLISEGALEMMDNRRIKVKTMTAVRLQELCDIRVHLETYAAQAALPYVKDKDVDELIRLNSVLNEAYEFGDVEGGCLANQAFHSYLYQCNPHQVTMRMIEGVWLQLGPFYRIVLDKIIHQPIRGRHDGILRALIDRDEQALKDSVEQDIRNAVSYIYSLNEFDEKAQKVNAGY